MDQGDKGADQKHRPKERPDCVYDFKNGFHTLSFVKPGGNGKVTAGIYTLLVIL